MCLLCLLSCLLDIAEGSVAYSRRVRATSGFFRPLRGGWPANGDLDVIPPHFPGSPTAQRDDANGPFIPGAWPAGLAAPASSHDPPSRVSLAVALILLCASVSDSRRVLHRCTSFDWRILSCCSWLACARKCGEACGVVSWCTLSAMPCRAGSLACSWLVSSEKPMGDCSGLCEAVSCMFGVAKLVPFVFVLCRGVHCWWRSSAGQLHSHSERKRCLAMIASRDTRMHLFSRERKLHFRCVPLRTGYGGPSRDLSVSNVLCVLSSSCHHMVGAALHHVATCKRAWLGQVGPLVCKLRRGSHLVNR
ncbi:uncharacterized protein V1518DRAFT_264175 [Limtongia smithiae]|uniref:uncharacterized protein n=1 Tax=Limtongia smithiae TaxID=1125753 RepID=UPI0034CD2D7F